MLHYGIPFMTPMHMGIQLITTVICYLYIYTIIEEKSLKYLLTNGVSHGNM